MPSIFFHIRSNIYPLLSSEDHYSQCIHSWRCYNSIRRNSHPSSNCKSFTRKRQACMHGGTTSYRKQETIPMIFIICIGLEPEVWSIPHSDRGLGDSKTVSYEKRLRKSNCSIKRSIVRVSACIIGITIK